MDLSTFLKFLHDGAYALFDQIMTQLSNQDLKALRLSFDKSLADLVFPFMFKQLFLSIHEEDGDVFNRIANHPTASRSVKQIFWDCSFCKANLILYENRDYEDQKRQLAAFLEADYGPSSFHWPDVIDQNQHLFAQALAFWIQKEKAWRANEETGNSLKVLKESIEKFPNLRRINVLMADWLQNYLQGMPTKCYDLLWTTPRSRNWSQRPFYKFLPFPRAAIRERHLTLQRSVDGLKSLCQSGHIKIGSLIIEYFGEDQKPHGMIHRLLRSSANNINNNDNYNNHLGLPPSNLNTVLDGFASNLPELRSDSYSHSHSHSHSGKVTVRFIIEKSASYTRSTWQTLSIALVPIDSLVEHCEHDLEELTYSQVQLAYLVDLHADRTDDLTSTDPSSTTNLCLLTHCKALRLARFHACWCTDFSTFLQWLWNETSVREVELHYCSSTKTSWYAVMNTLRSSGMTFDRFEVVSCRSSSSEWGPGSGSGFEPDVMAPWNGASEDTVRWLKGETNRFPLWQGPG